MSVAAAVSQDAADALGLLAAAGPAAQDVLKELQRVLGAVQEAQAALDATAAAVRDDSDTLDKAKALTAASQSTLQEYQQSKQHMEAEVGGVWWGRADCGAVRCIRCAHRCPRRRSSASPTRCSTPKL